jgi:agmatine deiminase
MTVIFPAEWAPHDRVLIGFPGLSHEWGDAFDGARAEIAAFANAVADGGAGENVHLIAQPGEAADMARTLVGPNVDVLPLDIGDIWVRDTGPIMVQSSDGSFSARDFGFNGWGHKYVMPGDETLAARVIQHFEWPGQTCDWVLEGGAIDVDGTGLCVTTEQCLLNPNRNPSLSREDITERLHRDLGIDRILWLGDGLAGDHTDGHVDNLARFVGPNTLLLPHATGDDDPNAAIYADAQARAKNFGVEVITIPSPGRFVQDSAIVPASHMNFYIGNRVVIMPAFGGPSDAQAAYVLEKLFPTRRIIPLASHALLSGGGSFHCSSQQIPV